MLDGPRISSPAQKCVPGVHSAAILAQASSSDKNQCVLEHAWRKRPLNDFTNALSVGLPGRLKSSVTLFSYAQRSSAFEMNAGPLSTSRSHGVHIYL